ncbi:TIGR01777 family oxidoreductase [Olleya sp. 1-3]|uniref:TIGR01777 family oxidoreductase n=1 Tax=Olleya sp. 1-3 TaxID=2058323 RepID=UPI000C3242AF|nr:TIGR01777 family oxidoreductase [Olleya sp. 1-3]PKG49692.1 TIGR01777 family protein [Olleya sp. 1-3]
MKKIIIAGGTGFLGQVLKTHFTKQNYTVLILSRQPKSENEIYWNGSELGDWTKHLENADALINLSGKSVDCRYTDKNKKTIYNSRIDTTNLLGLAVNLCDNPPKYWFNSSTATIYKESLDTPNTEKNGIIGDDFSMNIAKSWEQTFNAITTPKTKKVILRTSIVLGKNGGAIIPLKQLTRFGLGGKQASGQQKVSWIHEDDFTSAIQFLMEQKLEGVFNLCVPQPTDNKTLMQSLRHVLKVPFGISHPLWLLKLGAFFIGTETELVTKSRNVLPEKLLQHGFIFKFENIKTALENVLKK